MKAIAVSSFGATPEVVEVAAPIPGPGEIRVKVAAAAVNPADGKTAAGAYKGFGEYDFPLIPGIDGAGTIDMVGDGATGYAPGERVFGLFRHTPGGHGTFAEFAVAGPESTIAKTPDGLDDIRAAALPLAGTMALGILDTLELSAGATLLVVGATGGIGMFLTQLAPMRDILVIATARPEMAAEMRELGASMTVDHTSATPVAEQVLGAYPRGVDALVDLVGGQPAVTALSAVVREGGTVGSTARGVDEEALAPRHIRAINFQRQDSVQRLDELGRLAITGELAVPVERTVPFEHGPAVVEESKGGHLHGKTVIVIV